MAIRYAVVERGGLPPLDNMAKLAALAPRTKRNLTRFHGVLARGRLGAPVFRLTVGTEKA